MEEVADLCHVVDTEDLEDPYFSLEASVGEVEEVLAAVAVEDLVALAAAEAEVAERGVVGKKYFITIKKPSQNMR